MVCAGEAAASWALSHQISTRNQPEVATATTTATVRKRAVLGTVCINSRQGSEPGNSLDPTFVAFG